jgi:hypothetical protein
VQLLEESLFSNVMLFEIDHKGQARQCPMVSLNINTLKGLQYNAKRMQRFSNVICSDFVTILNGRRGVSLFVFSGTL